MSDEKRKRGRPSVAEQIAIDKKLRPHYLETRSVEGTANLTDHSPITVKKRFDRWDEEALKELTEEFDKGDSIHKTEFLRLNQFLIDQMQSIFSSMQNDISNARKNDDGSLSHLISVQIQLIRLLEDLNEKRCAVKIHPGAERVMRKLLDERLGTQPNV